MAFNFLPCDRDQPYLLPPSLKDSLPEDHLAFFLLDAVKEMDLRSFYVGYREDGWGGPGLRAHDDGDAAALRLLHRGALEPEDRAPCQEDIAFRVITANAIPDHSTIARFRQANEQALSACFTQVLRLCAAAGLVRVGVVTLDGTKIEANASLYANPGLEAIDAEVHAMLAEAAATDRREDELLGVDNRGDELPDALRSREERLRRLKKCKARLEAVDVKAKYEAELARRATTQQETRRRPVGRPPKPRKPTKNSLVANPTDPDSRVMKRQYAYLQGYNAEAVVSEDRIVLAAAITQEPVDLHQLHPMLHEARANLVSAEISKRIGVALADSGYYSEANLAVAEQEDPELLVAVVNERDQRRGESSGRGVFTGRLGRVMQGKLATERGRTLYANRAHTVEPVFGHIKEVRKVRRFARRGLGAYDVEWKLVCATHNLLKLWRHSRT
jgi:transposase